MNRKHRKQISVAIRDYLSGRLSAFEFDDLLDDFRDSDDSTVRYIAAAAWYFYDDCKDHYVHLNKLAWDYFQRLLLVLESGSVIVETKKKWHWHWTQLLAVMSLLLVVISATQMGLSTSLVLLLVAPALISFAISHCRFHRQSLSPRNDILAPFASFSELRATYDAAPQFTKTRYPKQIDTPIRSKLEKVIIGCQASLFWPILSPFVLLSQAFPVSSTDTQVISLQWGK